VFKFYIPQIIVDENNLIKNESEKIVKKAKLKNHSLLQIKINEMFSVYKVYSLKYPTYIIGAVLNYQKIASEKNITYQQSSVIKVSENLDTQIKTDTPINIDKNLEVFIKTGVDSFSFLELSKLPIIKEVFVAETGTLKNEIDTLLSKPELSEDVENDDTTPIAENEVDTNNNEIVKNEGDIEILNNSADTSINSINIVDTQIITPQIKTEIIEDTQSIIKSESNKNINADSVNINQKNKVENLDIIDDTTIKTSSDTDAYKKSINSE